MNFLYVILLLLLMTFPFTALPDGASSSDSTSLINHLNTYLLDAQYHRYCQSTIAYRRRTKQADGRIVIDRLVVQNGKDSDKIFGTLNLLFSEVNLLLEDKKPRFLRNIKPISDYENTYSFTLIDGLVLREGREGQSVPLTVEGKWQLLNDGRPRRCILEVASTPKGYATRQIQLIVTWNLIPIQLSTDEPFITCWLPTEVLLRGFVMNGKNEILVWSHLELEKVISLERSIVGPMKPSE